MKWTETSMSGLLGRKQYNADLGKCGHTLLTEWEGGGWLLDLNGHNLWHRKTDLTEGQALYWAKVDICKALADELAKME